VLLGLVFDIVGNGLIGEYFEGSLIKALQDSYPEHLWQSWKFVKLSQHYWADPQNIREILDYCQEKLKITSMDQWYTVQRDILHELIDGPLILCHISVGLATVL
jgi:hypothetical protein